MARLDRSLVDALAQTDPVTQRDIARWVTRRAFVEARLADVEWIAPALAAMDRGEPLPPPFDDDRRAWDLLLSDARVPRTLVTSPDGRLDNCLQQAMAFPALFSALEPDPLRAALDALWSAAVAFGHGGTRCCSARSARPFPRSRHMRNTERARTGAGPTVGLQSRPLGKAKLWHKQGEATASELAALLPIAGPGVSRHLRVLREAGLVELRQEARWRVYRLRPEPLAEVDEWLGRHRSLWEQRLHALHTEVARGKRQRRSSTRRRNARNPAPWSVRCGPWTARRSSAWRTASTPTPRTCGRR